MVISEYNPKIGILESKFKDVVRLQEVIDYIRATKENKTYPRVLKIITDSKDATFEFSAQDLGTIVKENNKSLDQYDQIIDAIIINNPKATAITMLYQELSKNEKYMVRIFSSSNAALSWLENY